MGEKKNIFIIDLIPVLVVAINFFFIILFHFILYRLL